MKDQNDFSVNIVLIDNYGNEHLIYENNDMMATSAIIEVDDLCEETCILNGVRPDFVQIEIKNAIVTINGFTYTTGVKAGWNVDEVWQEKKQEQDADKIARINQRIKEKGLHWVAGQTEVSQMSYSDRKKLYGQSTFPAGFEFYCGGVISTSDTGTESSLKSATINSPYVDEWDWRNRHGKNWMSPVTNQGACGSCWAFATTGATEAMVNLYYNQLLNLDLSEQDLLSCSGAGSCDGGLPSLALDYIKTSGIVDEG